MSKEEIIKKTIDDLLKVMEINGEVNIENSDDEIFANITTDQAGFLIGQEGFNLNAFQHLVRLLVAKKNNASIPFLLDVNNYRKNRITFLKQLAENIAQKSLTKKIVVTLQPMPAYERRVIHLALKNYSDINSQSTGEEPLRRIVVSPVSKK